MNRFLRKKIWRRLESLPDESAHAVLELLDELEAEEPVPGSADRADAGFQRVGEQVGEGLRRRRVPGAVRRSTMKALAVGDRVLEIVRETGREFLAELERDRPEPGPTTGEQPPRERRVVRR